MILRAENQKSAGRGEPAVHVYRHEKMLSKTRGMTRSHHRDDGMTSMLLDAPSSWAGL
jgi:hypothetical protein